MSGEAVDGGSAPLVVDADVPAGNIIVEEIDGDHLKVRQDHRGSIGGWFYWHFRVRGAAGRRLTVQFVDHSRRIPIGVRGPAASLDQGRSWHWVGADSVVDDTFTHDVPGDVDEVRYSVAMPYTRQDFDALLERHESGGWVKEELTRSEQDREVPLLRMGDLSGEPDHRVLLTCRHHCCEMMASYVLEGLVERALEANDDIGRWLAEHVEFTVVPFMDIDGVELGDQGKNRTPHDHGRDYGPDEGRYASVRALRDLLRDPGRGRFDIALDLHCPNLAGPTNERAYFVGSPDPANWERVQTFAAGLEEELRGPLAYRRESDLAFGTGWNTERNYQSRDGREAPQQSIGHFLDGVDHVGLHGILEFPYATVDGVEVNPDTARAFGADLAAAIARQLGKPHADDV